MVWQHVCACDAAQLEHFASRRTGYDSASYCLADGIDFTDLERAGQLGSPVLPADLEMLQIKPLRPFAAGEICAFKEALTPAQAAAAAAHRRAGSAEGKP